MELPLDAVPAADPTAEPQGFIVVADSGDRIHFLDWGESSPPMAPVLAAAAPHGVLLIHGLSTTAWIWTPVARRLRAARRVVAMDLRGHGLSDAPTENGAYDLANLAADAVAVAEGSGLLTGPDDRVVVAGHGFGAMVAAETAMALGARCAGLVLVDGGWESLEASTGLDVDGFLRGLDEPPEVLRSMTAFLADRAAFDPASWDADQEQAARATVVETHAGRVVPVTRPHVLEACVRTMFAYDPVSTLAAIVTPVAALVAAGSADDAPGVRDRALAAVTAAREAAGHGPLGTVSFRHDGHNLMRYRPDAVSAAILSVVGGVASARES
jgi:pimeloyl-ACP methyl ester carboxylesterase